MTDDEIREMMMPGENAVLLSPSWTEIMAILQDLQETEFIGHRFRQMTDPQPDAIVELPDAKSRS